MNNMATREEQHARYIDCGPQAWDNKLNGGVMTKEETAAVIMNMADRDKANALHFLFGYLGRDSDAIQQALQHVMSGEVRPFTGSKEAL